MQIILNNFNEHYEIEQLLRMFIKDITVIKEKTNKKQLLEFVYINKNKYRFFVYIKFNKNIYYKFIEFKNNKNDDNLSICSFLYDSFCKNYNKNLPWGLLTGVRPVRLMRNIQNEINDINKTKQKFKREFFVSDEKISLTEHIYNLQEKIIENVKKEDYSLYISIPFCPSRCVYCSFVSTTTKNSKKLMQDYTKKLCEELIYTAKKAKELNFNLKTIYIGGGTPTAISALELEEIMKTISENFNIDSLEEYTVEAGRADCTDFEKLLIIKKYGADRISINPQTFSNEVLKNIGRNHTHEDFLNCVEMARKIGFKSINMDLIAGLPLDDIKSFENSVKGCIELGAENITIHSLTLKRASNLVMKNIGYNEDTDIKNMLKKSEILKEYGYEPYYMYRQKSTVQNLENVGYTKKGLFSYYNIYMMEEVGNIISCGAGGVSKLVFNNEDIKRVYNYKYPTEYINDFNTIIKRKDEVFNLWQHFGFPKG